MQKANLPIPKHWYRAKDWLNWGVDAHEPLVGAVAVLGRTGGGHVFFVTKQNPLYVWGVGGNQAYGVNEAKFLRGRVLGYRWPVGVPRGIKAPKAADDGKPVSNNEA